MHNHLTTELANSKYQLGFDIMGPILAECCYALYTYFNNIPTSTPSRALFCARGGLILKKACDVFLNRIGKTQPLPNNNFMVSRLAAVRLAFESSAEEVVPFLKLEFEGRSCADVASVLSGKSVPSTGQWRHPYEYGRLLALMSDCSLGRDIRDAMREQEALLRAHIAYISKEYESLYIVDTGVFGSIGKFLSLGLTDRDIHPLLLFHANYKKSSDLTPPTTVGLICDHDHYNPRYPRSVSRLYWPFIESFFEPELSSVRTYTRGIDGEILSNLQEAHWEDKLSLPNNPIKLGAFDYIDTLTPDSVPSILDKSTDAWRKLQKRIITPTSKDVDLLAVHQRCLDFGFDDIVSFGMSAQVSDTSSHFATITNSIWPEGEIRRLYPRTAGILLHFLEVKRIISSIMR